MKKRLLALLLFLLVFSLPVYADLTATEGLAIDLSSAGAGLDFTISFDTTELFGSRTWGDASTDLIVWTWNRATGTDPTITFNDGSIALPALTLTTDLAVTEGGTGASTFTDHGILLGSGAAAITALGSATDGQLPIGSTGADPVLATLTEGLAIDVTNAAGAITLIFDPTEITGGTTWDDGGEGSVIWTWNLAAGDPAITFGNGVVNISTGALQEGGVGVPNTGDNLSVFAATTSAQLYGVLSDETGSAAGAPLAVFNVNPVLTGATLAGILADNDDMVFEADADSNGSNKYSFTDGASTEIYSLTEAGAIDWTNGNVVYVPIGGDIQTYVTAATAGDTLILASGSYTITSTITVAKQLNIVGQGNAGFLTAPVTASHGTLISSATDGVVCFQINSDNVRIAHLSINLTGAGSTGINTAKDLDGLVFTNIDVIVSCTAVAQGFTIWSSNSVLRNLTFDVRSSNSAAYGVWFYNDNTSAQDAICDCFTVNGTVDGAATEAMAYVCENGNDGNTLILNMESCRGVAESGTNIDAACVSRSTTTFNSTVNTFLCTLDGADYDLYQTGTNVLTAGGSVVVNNKIFGTPTYRATMVSQLVYSSGKIQTGVAGTDGQIVIYSEEGAADQTVTINPHADMTQDVVYTLPADDGAAGTYLKSDGAGALSWDTPAGAGDILSVGDALSGAALDGTDDGGTWIKFYDAQGAGQLITGDLSEARVWTFPNRTGTVLLSGDTLTGDVTATFDTDGTTATTLADDVVAAAEMADADHGDVAWSGGAASVQAMTVNDALTGTKYVALFAADTGVNQPVYTDAPLSYAQATGTLSSTQFSGGGASVTGVNAATGDSATAFFSAGTIEHEYGGLEANVSAYSGLVAIAGDATAEVDALSELIAQLADVTAFITDDDMPAAAADPDIDAAGEIGRDTDGGNETGDSSLRGHDGSNQFLYARKLKTINFTLISPDTIDAADLIPIWLNTSGFTFTIVEWHAWSDDDNVSLELEEITSMTDFTAITTIDAVEIASNGTSCFYASDTTITHAAIETDHLIAIDFDTADTPDYVKISITGWYDSNVN